MPLGAPTLSRELEKCKILRNRFFDIIIYEKYKKKFMKKIYEKNLKRPFLTTL